MMSHDDMYAIMEAQEDAFCAFMRAMEADDAEAMTEADDRFAQTQEMYERATAEEIV